MRCKDCELFCDSDEKNDEIDNALCFSLRDGGPKLATWACTGCGTYASIYIEARIQQGLKLDTDV